MRNRISTLRIFVGFCILLIATVLPNICLAQNEEAPQLYTFGYLQVKPGMSLEFEEFIKGVLPELRSMGITEMDIWKTSNFGVSDKYLVITPARTPEAMDAELATDETMVPVGLVPVMSALNRMLVGSQDVMVIPRTELNLPTAEDYQMKLALILHIGTAPFRAAEFESGAKQVVGMMSQTGVKGVYINKIGYGGNLDEYMICIFFDSFADMAATMPKIEQKMVEAQLAPPSGLIYYRQSEVYVRVPALGIQPEAQ